MTNMRLFGPWAAAFTFAAILVAMSLAQADSAGTVGIHYTPAHMTRTAMVSGSCWEPSIAVDRRDAFRCMSGNNINDPCFAYGSGTVYCPTDIVADRGIVIKLTKPLPAPDKSNKDAPWAMQVQTAGFCQVGTGTVVMDFPFYCHVGVCSAPYPAEESMNWYAKCGEPLPNGMTVVKSATRLVTKYWR